MLGLVMPHLFLILHLALAQSDSTNCNSACMNYLAVLANEKDIANAAVWDYSGPVTAHQIATVCGGNPLACCQCGGTGLTSGIETEVLIAWTLTCNTYNTVQDGGASAVTCWTSHFHEGCVDYDNLLEGASCGSGGGGSGSGSDNAQTSGSGYAQSSGSGYAQSTGTSNSEASSSKTSGAAVSQTPSASNGIAAAVHNHRLVILGAIFGFAVNTLESVSG